MSEDIAAYLQEQNIKAVFIHSKMNVFERYQAISSLRRGVYDVIVGINLLKEGIDIPEVSLVCIIDADKSGFLRDFRSLVQIVGRAARNKNGKVIFYASRETNDMKKAIEETERRRKIQLDYNIKNNNFPKSVKKDIKSVLLDSKILNLINEFKNDLISNEKKEKSIKNIEKLMKKAVKEFKFEKAIELRNLLLDLKSLL
jgi:excinuclease ABC subunit B